LGCNTCMYSWFKVDLDCCTIRVVVTGRVSKLTWLFMIFIKINLKLIELNIIFGNTLISWKFSKQHMVSGSFTKLGIKSWPTTLLRLYDFSIYCQICRLLLLLCIHFGVIIYVLFICLRILYFMLVLNMLRFIIILYVTRLPRKIFKFILSLPRINKVCWLWFEKSKFRKKYF